jgi:hypothetical protein
VTLQKLDVVDNPRMYGVSVPNALLTWTTVPGLLTGCVVTSQSSISANWVHLFVSSLTYESECLKRIKCLPCAYYYYLLLATLFLLTLAQAWNLNRRGVGTPIMTLLTRDGAWYFLVRGAPLNSSRVSGAFLTPCFLAYRWLLVRVIGFRNVRPTY